MLSSSFIVLLAASSFVNGLPTWHKRQLPGVAAIPSLVALDGTLGNVTSLDSLANIPGANHVANAAGKKAKGEKAAKQKGGNKKGNKKATANAGAGNVDVGLVANSTSVAGAVETEAANNVLVGGETGVVNGTAVETGLGANSTATATEVPGNAAATGEIGGNTVTVTVTVTEIAGAANTTVGEAGATSTIASEVAGATSTSLSASLTSPPVASESSVAGGAGTPDIASLSNALSLIQTHVSPGQAGRGHAGERAAQVNKGGD